MRAVVFDLDHTIFDANQVLREGVAELLAILKNLGLQLGAVSNNDHRMLVRLDEAGIRQHFSQVLCSDHTDSPKSALSVRQLTERLGATPQETAMVSHAHADILPGKEAGLAKTIGISHGHLNAVPLHEAGADHIVFNIPAILDVLH
jgi:phosphoglycolate phosphatase-like HAD superfamily hydrolase